MKRKYNSRYAPTLRAVAGRGPVVEPKAPDVEPFSDEELARWMKELASMPLELGQLTELDLSGFGPLPGIDD